MTNIARVFLTSLLAEDKCDNKAAITISENLIQHVRTKQVEVDKYFIKEKIEDSSIELLFVKSEDQLADILTKVVTGTTFTRVLSKISIGDPTAHIEGEC